MLESAVIEKNKPLLPSQEYATLREQGITYIQNLSGKIWTDHNLHDPGITTLEALCYALTDLGYRTGFDIQDLLATPDGSIPNPDVTGFFPAHDILTNAPLTLYDYRKLLLKIEGIRNAWLDPMMDPARPDHYKLSEIPIYADCDARVLTFNELNAQGRPRPQVKLSGLYKVLLELEIDDLLGSLNEPYLRYQVPRGELKGVVLLFDAQDDLFLKKQLDFDLNFNNGIQVHSVAQDTNNHSPTGTHFVVDVEFQLSDNSTVHWQALHVYILEDKPRGSADPVAVTTARIEALVADNGADAPLSLFWLKQQTIKKSLDQACCILDAHRNLCEDFLSIETVKPHHVGICADIEVAPGADLEVVQAEVYHAIEQYFNPPVHYYTLKELLDEGLCPDEIFDGPYINYAFTCNGEAVFTKPGFIKDVDLEASELRQVIYTSDIINELMDIEGVVSIKNVLLRAYNVYGKAIGQSEKWCLDVPPLHQPVLFIEGSKLLLFKNGFPYTVKPTEFIQTLNHLRALAQKAAYVEPGQILPQSYGRYRNLDRFYSIQHDFPQTYGIGEAGLPQTVSETRVAQARQFKAYLTVFDQMLADYLAQLAHVPALFSLDAAVEQSYFSQYLTDMAGVRDVFEDEFYLDKNTLQPFLESGALSETREEYFERRNRLLDHLLARFAEQFTDYVMMMFRLDGDPLKTSQELIQDKIAFLKEYPLVSRERGKAFNYRPEDPALIWDTDQNIAGLKRRVSRLLGIDDPSRQNLACDTLFAALFTTGAVGNQHRVEIKRADDTPLFKSSELFATPELALAEAEKLFPVFRQETTYQIDTSGGTNNIFYAITDGGTTLTQDELFATEADAVRQIRELIQRYDTLLESEACDLEGFHLIEHILLRPVSSTDALLNGCIPLDCTFCGDEDPYSFRISVLLPYWPERFQNLNFRRFFERTLREETPAHIHARICWISQAHMTELDERYRAWLEAKSVKQPDAQALEDALADLIDILGRLKTIYPEATLHDCEEGGDENPVRLGQTNLGLF